MPQRAMLLFFLLGLYSSVLFADKTIAELGINQPKETKPYHAYALATLVKQELETLRYAMGKPAAEDILFVVENAEPREVYFQANSLAKKMDRLYFELTFTKSTDLIERPKKLTPGAVWQQLHYVLIKIRELKQRYQISEKKELPPLDRGKRPSDVYQMIMVASQHLNVMLSQPYMPSDVFQEITTSIYLSFRINQKLGVSMAKESPKWIGGKRPKDVYGEMLGVYATISQIMQKKGVNTLVLKPKQGSRNIYPGDVYDLAVLVNSQLTYLYSTMSEESVHEAVYPGVKFPSHVYQRAEFLHLQLKESLKIMDSRSSRLSGNG